MAATITTPAMPIAIDRRLRRNVGAFSAWVGDEFFDEDCIIILIISLLESKNQPQKLLGLD
jgi:hypothetical protein